MISGGEATTSWGSQSAGDRRGDVVPTSAGAGDVPTRYYSSEFNRMFYFRESDLVEDAMRGTGPGGGATNRRAQSVVLRHQPSGIIVRQHHWRSLYRNRLFARMILHLKLEQRLLGNRSLLAQFDEHRNQHFLKQKRKARRGMSLHRALTKQRQETHLARCLPLAGFLLPSASGTANDEGVPWWLWRDLHIAWTSPLTDPDCPPAVRGACEQLSTSLLAAFPLPPVRSEQFGPRIPICVLQFHDGAISGEWCSLLTVWAWWTTLAVGRASESRPPTQQPEHPPGALADACHSLWQLLFPALGPTAGQVGPWSKWDTEQGDSLLASPWLRPGEGGPRKGKDVRLQQMATTTATRNARVRMSLRVFVEVFGWRLDEHEGREKTGAVDSVPPSRFLVARDGMNWMEHRGRLIQWWHEEKADVEEEERETIRDAAVEPSAQEVVSPAAASVTEVAFIQVLRCLRMMNMPAEFAGVIEALMQAASTKKSEGSSPQRRLARPLDIKVSAACRRLLERLDDCGLRSSPW